MEKPKLYIHGDIAITCGDWKMPDSLTSFSRRPINDAMMADLMTSFKKAACKEYRLPDGTFAQDVLFEDGIRSVIDAYFMLTSIDN